MSLRPLPNLEDAQALAKLGRHHALRNARLDAVHALRDAVVRLQSGQCDDASELESARGAIARLEDILNLEKSS